MNEVTWLAIWAFAFFASHILMSHPLRAPMVKAFGTMGFQVVYSIISLGTLIMAARAYSPAQEGANWMWTMNYYNWGIATFLVWIGMILFVGSVRRNPAMPHPEAKAYASSPAEGVYAITRHPMMWGFSLWAIGHIIVNPTVPSFIISAMIIGTALIGAAGQDKKKAALMGEAWDDWSSRTSFWPYGKGFNAFGTFALVGGTILFLGLSFAHQWLVGAKAGIFLWL